jgi:hypothetical protein
MSRILHEEPYTDVESEGGDVGEGLSNQAVDDSGDDQSND